ncbi:hypothetical protein QTP88_028800 [Uroleucon formosanum]
MSMPMEWDESETEVVPLDLTVKNNYAVSKAEAVRDGPGKLNEDTPLPQSGVESTPLDLSIRRALLLKPPPQPNVAQRAMVGVQVDSPTPSKPQQQCNDYWTSASPSPMMTTEYLAPLYGMYSDSAVHQQKVLSSLAVPEYSPPILPTSEASQFHKNNQIHHQLQHLHMQHHHLLNMQYQLHIKHQLQLQLRQIHKQQLQATYAGVPLDAASMLSGSPVYKATSSPSSSYSNYFSSAPADDHHQQQQQQRDLDKEQHHHTKECATDGMDVVNAEEAAIYRQSDFLSFRRRYMRSLRPPMNIKKMRPSSNNNSGSGSSSSGSSSSSSSGSGSSSSGSSSGSSSSSSSDSSSSSGSSSSSSDSSSSSSDSSSSSGSSSSSSDSSSSSSGSSSSSSSNNDSHLLTAGKQRNNTKRKKNEAAKLSWDDKQQKYFENQIRVMYLTNKLTNVLNCEKSRKVPIIEQMFLKDQRSVKKMAMSSIDVLTTKKRNKNMHRKEIEANRIDKQNKKELCVNNTLETIETDETYYTDTGDNTAEDSNYSPNSMSSLSSTYSANKQSQMRLELRALAIACDRTGIPDRTAATIASAILQDVEIIKTDDKQYVIDRMKIRRERHKKRQDLKIQTDKQPKSLYFDGRKDHTFINQKTDDKYYRNKITEEHITLIREPRSRFMGHCTPVNGTAIKEQLNKPLQWVICQLHANELPLRHLFQHLDGKTSGKRGFSGVLRKQLENCHSNMPFLETAIDLNTDQKYLFNICVSIINGECFIDLARTNPGKQAHSRWLITANRILRLYISTETPEENLITLTEFILKVYAPMWFHIKMKSFCSLDSKHIWQTIQFSRYLPKNYQQIIDPVIQRNSYFGAPENILLSMLVDDRMCIRELAIQKIFNSRLSKTTGVRIFKVPLLNFDASDYTELVDWNKCKITEPPILSMIENEVLNRIVMSGQVAEYINIFPCHTQAIERVVKLVTDASTAVCSESGRDGFIRARIKLWAIMPSFNTKKRI